MVYATTVPDFKKTVRKILRLNRDANNVEKNETEIGSLTKETNFVASKETNFDTSKETDFAHPHLNKM